MRTNLAGRAGRWSAAHWKLAALGWIAFAVAAVRGRRRRRRQGDEAVGDRERRFAAGRADPRPGALQRPGARERARAVVHDDGRPAGVRIGRRGAHPDARTRARRDEHRLADRPSACGPRLGRPPLRARPVRRQGQGRGRRGQDRADPRRRRPGAGRQPEPDHRGVRPGVGGPPARPALRARHGPGRDHVAAAHARDPARCVRRARRGGPAGAARVLGGPRGDRAQQPAQPRAPDRPADARRDHPDDRHGGRNRLLALLPAARARGAPRGSDAARRAALHRAHLGPGGARLRVDRADRDGRDVRRRQLALQDDRARDDDRRPRGDDRLADRAAGAAAPARRQRRPGPHPDLPRPAARRRRLGPVHRPRAAAPADVGAARPAGCWSRWRCRRSACTRSCRT